MQLSFVLRFFVFISGRVTVSFQCHFISGELFLISTFNQVSKNGSKEKEEGGPETPESEAASPAPEKAEKKKTSKKSSKEKSSTSKEDKATSKVSSSAASSGEAP